MRKKKMATAALPLNFFGVDLLEGQTHQDWIYWAAKTWRKRPIFAHFYQRHDTGVADGDGRDTKTIDIPPPNNPGTNVVD